MPNQNRIKPKSQNQTQNFNALLMFVKFIPQSHKQQSIIKIQKKKVKTEKSEGFYMLF